MKKVLGFLSFIILFFNPEYFSQYLWENTNASLGSKVNAIVVNSNNEVFACTDSSGIYFSPDLGNSWLPVNNGLTSSTIIALAVSPTTQTLTALDYSGLYRSIDNGSSWFQINFTSSVFRLDCNLNGDFFGGTTVGGVIKSTDDGVSWFYSNSGLTQYSIYSFAFVDTVTVFCSSYNGAVYISNDFGNIWTPIFLPYGSGDIVALAAFDSVLYAGSGMGIFTTNYYGQINWTERNNGLLNKSIRNIRINSYGYIYVSTAGGIFRSLNSAAGWDEFNSGLSDLNVTSLALAPDGFLYCGTASGNIFKTSSPTLVDQNNGTNPELFSLSQNYPNPFNPTTTIAYQIPQIGFVTLKVYDLLGREVATLVNEEKLAGSYEIQFTAKGLTSGIYFYQLKAGDPSAGSGQGYTETKKMILLR